MSETHWGTCSKRGGAECDCNYPADPMSDEYTPTMYQVRAVWCAFSEYGGLVDREHSGLWDDRLAEFDRWLADHDERVKAEAKAGSLPEGAKWFPDEGGIQWQGKVYFPADYVLTRSDIAKLRAEAKAEALEEAALDICLTPVAEWKRHGNSGIRENAEADASAWLDAQAAAIRAAAENGESDE